ncbi:MAG: GNAT family N-acetyltransferase [Candidatus Diapherotrites archaeon]|nr:GNAT family N-acetyltransferase [Candidatus Diapherotrites archaeon]
MRSKPVIRTIQKKDINRVYSIGKQFFFGPDKWDWGWTIEYVTFLSEYHTDTFFVAEMNGSIIGFIVSKAPISSDKPTVGWLESMAVLPENQKKGVGTALMDQAIKVLKKKGMHSVRLTNWQSKKHLNSLYEKYGFSAKDHLIMREKMLE